MKAVSEYTTAELAAIGKKKVEQDIKNAAAEKEKRALVNKLVKAYEAGKIKLPE